MNNQLPVLQANAALHIRSFTLNFNGRKTLQLIKDCIDNKTVLDRNVLQEWYLEQIVKVKNKTISTNYLFTDTNGRNVYRQENEYEYLKRRSIECGGELPYYYLTDAKRILKYSIGSLVLRGLIMVVPVINLDNVPDEIENKKSTND